MITRDQLITTVRQALESSADVDAAWEGGSAAFGTHDEYSDIDAVAVVADEAVAATFELVESALAALSPVALRYDVPGTVGYHQKFFHLQGTPEHLVIDLVLFQRSAPLQFRAVELHGRGPVWFDRQGLLREEHLDVAQDQAQARARVPQLRAAFAMFQHLATKERLRGRAVDALAFYQAATMRPLVEALRLLHCPEKRGFGLRYVQRDLPADVAQRVAELSFVASLEDLAHKHAQAQAWFWQLMAELEARGPGAAAVKA